MRPATPVAAPSHVGPLEAESWRRLRVSRIGAPAAAGVPKLARPGRGQPGLGQHVLGQRSLGQPGLGQHVLGQQSLGQRSLGQRSLRGETRPEATVGHHGVRVPPAGPLSWRWSCSCW